MENTCDQFYEPRPTPETNNSTTDCKKKNEKIEIEKANDNKIDEMDNKGDREPASVGALQSLKNFRSQKKKFPALFARPFARSESDSDYAKE